MTRKQATIHKTSATSVRCFDCEGEFLEADALAEVVRGVTVDLGDRLTPEGRVEEYYVLIHAKCTS